MHARYAPETDLGDAVDVVVFDGAEAPNKVRAGLRGGGGVGMGVSGMVSVGLVLGCIEAKFCK